MKVIQANKHYYPTIGGVETVVQTLAEGMIDRGHDATVITAQSRGFGSHDRIDGVDILRTTSFGSVASVPIAPTYPIRLQRQYSSADIVHHHVPNPLGTISDLLSSPDCPTVATYHSDIVRQSRLLRIYRPALKQFLDGLDRIFVTSPRLVEHSKLLQEYTGKCQVVPLSIDIAAHEQQTVKPMDIPGSDERPTLLVVGRLNYYKGVDQLIDAMAHLETDADLLIVGNGPRENSLQKQATEGSATDRIHFLGYQNQKKLKFCYEKADIFVLPSIKRSEAFGIVQLEAMFHETPVINTNLRSGVPWVSQDGETGLTVPPNDPGALAAAIDDLLTDPERRRNFGIAAKRRVKNKFGQKQMLDTIEREYERLGQ
jgi:rhamnosyl/mannosyltransferase